jgi:hypothetical protein
MTLFYFLRGECPICFQSVRGTCFGRLFRVTGNDELYFRLRTASGTPVHWGTIKRNEWRGLIFRRHDKFKERRSKPGYRNFDYRS